MTIVYKIVPHRIQNITVLTNSQQLIWDSDCVHVRMFAVVEIRVWPPNPFQHLDRK